MAATKRRTNRKRQAQKMQPRPKRETAPVDPGPNKLLVRIYDYNPATGNVARRYTYMGKRFDIDLGWYAIATAMAERLRRVTHPDTGANVFEVCTFEEAMGLDDMHPMPGNKALPASRAAQVKGREFTRAREVVAAENSDDSHEDDDLDAILTPGKRKRDAETEFDESFDPGKDPEPTEPTEDDTPKPRARAKKTSRRRSATK